MMDKPKTYATAMAFRRALEDRLKQIAKVEKFDFQRLMREVAFDRLLARLFAREDAPWLLKGGYAMELRLKDARATKDLDLALRQTLSGGGKLDQAILAALRAAAAAELNDFFMFEVGEPMQDLDAAPSGGARYPVESLVDGRTYVKFHIDIGAGDVVIAPAEVLVGRDWLGFAGIAAVKAPAIPREQQFAEKLHAYTLPRKVLNSRTRDLVDMVLLINAGKLDKKRTAQAISETFARRGTHPVPEKLVPPPVAWTAPFALLTEECGLSSDIGAAFAVVDDYFTQGPHG